MRKSTSAPLEGNIEELFREFYVAFPGEYEDDHDLMITAKIAFKDGFFGPLVIPAADGAGVVQFHNRELLMRFAHMSILAQQKFLKALRYAFKKWKVDRINLEVQWSPKRERTVVVTRINVGNLDFRV